MSSRLCSSIAASVLMLLSSTSFATLVSYSQDFEALDQAAPDSLTNDGWQVFGNVFESNGDYRFGYGPFGAPNGGPGFSGIDIGQGGPAQGQQQLVVYSDYNCCPPDGGQDIGHFNGTDIVEANVFQQQMIGADNIGQTWLFDFDAKQGNIEGASTAGAFIKTLDPNAGFFLSNFELFDTTSIGDVWVSGQLSLEITADLVGQILQFGFINTASNFEGSGVFYDNINFAAAQAASEPGILMLFGGGLIALIGLRRRMH